MYEPGGVLCVRYTNEVVTSRSVLPYDEYDSDNWMPNPRREMQRH